MTTHSSIATRRLTIDDYDAVANLYGSARRWMETEMSKSFFAENLALAKDQYLIENPSRVLLGTFLNRELILTSGLFFWKNMPFCTILRFVGNLESASPVAVTKCLISLFDAFLDEIELRKRTRFYLLTSGHHLSILSKIGAKLTRVSRDYFMTVEAVVPPGVRPEEEYVWIMMGEKTWPVPLVLRAGTAYNHIRSFDKAVVDAEVLNAWSAKRADSESARISSGAEDES